MGGWALCRRMRLLRTGAIEEVTTEKAQAGDEENPAPTSDDSADGKAKKSEEMEDVASNSTQTPSEVASDNNSEEGIEGKLDAAGAPVPPESCTAQEFKM